MPLPRKAMALLAYLCLEAGPHTRVHLSALLWPESDEVHAAMSLRQALSKLREVLGDALVTDRQQVRLQRQDVPLADICDVHRFEALLAHDPVTACGTDVHRFLDALTVDDAPEFVHWGDRTRARLSRIAVEALRRAAVECRAQRDWVRLRHVSMRWLAFDPLSVDAACDAIESAFLTRDVAGALAQRDLVLQTLAREELDDDELVTRIRVLVQRYERVAPATPAMGVPALAMPRADHEISLRPPAWRDAALLERQHAWQQIATTFDTVQRESRAHWLTVTGGVGAGRSRLLRDALTHLVERGATVMSGAAQPGDVGFSGIAALLKSVLQEDGLAGVPERTLRTLCVLVPDLAEVFSALRRNGAAGDAADAAFAVQIQDALVQVCEALAEEHPLVIALDDAMSIDRDSATALQHVMPRVAHLPVLWLATDADDEIQARGHGTWAAVIRAGLTVPLAAITSDAVARLLSDCTATRDGWRALAERLHAAAHGMPGAVINVLEQLEQRWGPVSEAWQRYPLDEVPMPTLAPRLRGHIDGLDVIARTMLLSLALVMERGHPVPLHEWHTRPVLTLDDLSHIHGISRLRGAVLGEQLVECGLAVEDQGGFRCASPMVVAYALTSGSGLVREELRRLIGSRIPG